MVVDFKVKSCVQQIVSLSAHQLSVYVKQAFTGIRQALMSVSECLC